MFATEPKAGTLAGYNFSPAMAKSGIIWNEKTIDSYLEHPRTTVAGNKMAFPGLANVADRQNIVAYLKTVK
jgi:cytochrome c